MSQFQLCRGQWWGIFPHCPSQGLGISLPPIYPGAFDHLTFFTRQHCFLAKLGNIVAEANNFQFSRMGNIYCGNKFSCSETRKCFCLKSKTFLLPRHKFCFRNTFPSLATPENITRNNVSATMFPRSILQ